MNLFTVYALSGIALFGIGLYGMINSSHLIRKIIAANVMSAGVFLVFVALARRAPDILDPVPQAMVITGIVVAVSTTAVALALTLRVVEETGKPALPGDSEEDN